MSDKQTFGFLEEALNQTRQAFRGLLKTPIFSLVAVLSLAICIGSNMVIFSMIDAILLKPLPVAHPQELFQMMRVEPDEMDANFSYPMFERLRAADGMPETTGFAMRTARLNLPHTRDAATELVADNYLKVLAVQPAIGHGFSQSSGDGATPAAAYEVIISDALWSREFASDPAVVGKTLNINSKPFTVAGVMPRSFYGMSLDYIPDLWVPLSAQPAFEADSLLNTTEVNWVQLFTRLSPGNAAAEVARRGDPIFQESMKVLKVPTDEPQSLTLIPFSLPLNRTRRGLAMPLQVFMSIVFLIFVIACTSVAILLAARAARLNAKRAGDAIQGSNPRRLVKQFFAESAVIAFFGSLVGLGLALWGNQLLLGLIYNGRLIPGAAHPALVLSLGLRTLGAIALLFALATLLSGIQAAFRARRVESLASSKDSSAPRTRGDQRAPGRWLLVWQIAVSLLLIVTSGLFLSSFRRLTSAGVLGFQPANVAHIKVDLNKNKYNDAQLRDLYAKMYDRLQTLPGVEASGMSYPGLFSGTNFKTAIDVTGRLDKEFGAYPEVFLMSVTPGYFATMQTAVVEGREFNETDKADGVRKAMVNEAAAESLFGGEDPVGKRIGLFGYTEPLQVIGIVKNTKLNNPVESAQLIIYTSMAQTLYMKSWRMFDLKVAGDPGPVLNSARAAIRELDQEATLNMRPLDRLVDGFHWIRLVMAWLSGFFGVLGLVLTCIAIYGSVSFNVIRHSKGARGRNAPGAGRHVGWQSWSEVMGSVLIGVVVGVVAALIVQRMIGDKVFGPGTSDPVMMAAGIGFIVLVAGIIAYLSTLRVGVFKPIAASPTLEA